MPSKTYVMVRSAPPEAGRVSNHARRQCNLFLAQPQFIASPTDNCVLLRQVRRRNGRARHCHGEAIYRFKGLPSRKRGVCPRESGGPALAKAGDGMLPSDFFRRNVVLSFQEDAIGIRLRDIIGPDNMMWVGARTIRTASRRFSNRGRSWPGCRTTSRPSLPRTPIRGSPAATPPACTILTWRG